jgi:hypothetical protein
MTIRHTIVAALSGLTLTAALAAPVITPVTTSTGVNMLGEINASEYTLDMTFSLNNISGWRKIVDFNNRTDDAGLYLYWDQVSFATTSETLINGSGTAGAESGTRLTLTRDNTGLVSAYLNGAFQLSFNDITNAAVFGSTGGQTSAWLLADDVLFDSREQASGIITSVKVFDHALSAREIAAVPEPETMALVAAGLLTAFTLGRRRQHKA